MNRAEKVTIGIAILIILLSIGYLAYAIIAGYMNKPALAISGYYDSSGSQIGSSRQSVVNGIEGVKYITLKINVENQDKIPLSLEIASASPASFSNALNLGASGNITVSPGQFGTWESRLIDITPFENTTQNFSVTVLGKSPFRNPATQSSTISIKIEQNPTSAFSIQIVSQANNSMVIEPPVTPPPPSSSGVKFRTTDLGYGGSIAVAYTAQCGQPLKAYGKTSGACTSYSCASATSEWSVPSSSGALKFWVQDTDNVCICDIGRTTGYPVRYSTTDADASKISTSITSIDPSMEVLC